MNYLILVLTFAVFFRVFHDYERIMRNVTWALMAGLALNYWYVLVLFWLGTCTQPKQPTT